MPQPAVWGPVLWKLLHGLGAIPLPEHVLLRSDASRELEWIIGHLESIITCLECKRHVEEYKKKTPYSASSIGLWLHTFHEAVNQRLGKPTGPPFTQDLGVLTGKELRMTWKEYKAKSGATGPPVKEFERHFLLCLGFLGL